MRAIEELVRIVKANGLVLIYVWAMEQETERNLKESSHQIEMQTLMNMENNLYNLNNLNGNVLHTTEGNSRLKIEVSEGRNTFQQQDLLIPWHLKGEKRSEDKVEEKLFHRFYHVFIKGELEELCSHVHYVKVEDTYFDCGNWCIILRKENI